MHNLETKNNEQTSVLNLTKTDQIDNKKNFKGKALKIVGENKHFSPANKE